MNQGCAIYGQRSGHNAMVTENGKVTVGKMIPAHKCFLFTPIGTSETDFP